MLKELFFAVWFFLPAGAANMIPIPVAAIPQLKRFDYPIDCGKTWRGKRVFGGHKTWRGLVAGIVFSTITLAVQQLLVAHSGWLRDWTSRVDYAQLPVLLLGPLFALGALGGDAVESFFKRQIGIAPGRGWFPFDQIDFIIGAAIASVPFVSLGIWQYAALILFWFAASLGASAVGYTLGLKERPI